MKFERNEWNKIIIMMIHNVVKVNYDDYDDYNDNDI